MRILVVDQCSGSKEAPDWFEPFDVKEVDSRPLDELIRQERVPTLPASDLYQGRQQQRISSAIRSLRDNGDLVDRLFISAGFGVIEEDRELPPYEVTFQNFSETEIKNRSQKLGIHKELIDKIQGVDDYDIIFLALGNDYVNSLDLEEFLGVLSDDTIVVLFNRDECAREHKNAISIPARTHQAEQFGTIVIALKGLYLQNFAEHRKHGFEISSAKDVEKACMTEYSSQYGLDEF